MSYLSKNQCCTNRSWSEQVVAIDISCYLRPKWRCSIFGPNNIRCQWQQLDVTQIGQYNIDFLKIRTTGNKVLQRKSTFFYRTLNFLNKPLFWPCVLVTDYLDISLLTCMFICFCRVTETEWTWSLCVTHNQVTRGSDRVFLHDDICPDSLGVLMTHSLKN